MSKVEQNERCHAHTFLRMSIKGTLLCIHKDLTQMEQRKLFLENNEYKVVTASPDQDSQTVLSSRHVDAIVLECTPDFAVAKAMKKISPRIPVVAVVNSLDLPNLEWDSIDALVASFDGPQFLLDTLRFVLKVRPNQARTGAHNTKSVREDFANSTASAWRASINYHKAAAAEEISRNLLTDQY